MRSFPRAAVTSFPVLLAVLLAVLMLASLGVGCGPSSPDSAEAPATSKAAASDTDASTVLAAYVLLAAPPGGGPAEARARVIVDDTVTACPELLGGPQPVDMVFRQNPHGFDVKVCEALIPFDQALTVSTNGQALPTAKRNPTHPIIFGDTGCKLGTADDGKCPEDALAQPFGDLATAAAKLGPDLVLHVGDFNYRGTGGYDNTQDVPEYDAGDIVPSGGDPKDCQLVLPYVSQNADDTGREDSWQSWQVDFFGPAASLLEAAPWVVARGNHELCSRAGPGWFYFLDPSAEPEAGGDGQLACPDQNDDGRDVIEHLVLRPPTTVDLGTLRLAVLDSSNACDAYAPEETTAIYAEQWRKLLADAAASEATTWLLTHRPVWGVEGDASSAEVGSVTLERSLAEALGTGSFDNEIQLLVAGHQHKFSSVTFTEGSRPPQLVVGDSGVKLESDVVPGPFPLVADGVPAVAMSIHHHAFLEIPDLQPNGSFTGVLWKGEPGTVRGRCDSSNPPSPLCVAVDSAAASQAAASQ